jgi:PAS domain S-box-containing protein
LFEAAQDGILLLNGDTAKIEDANPYLVKMLGYTYSQLIGRKLWDVGAFSDIAESKEKFFELQRAGFIRYENLPLRTIDGDIIEVEFVSTRYDCDGVPVIQCDIRDMTKHRLAERALVSAEAKFRGLVEQVIAGIFIIQRRVIVYVNAAGAEIIGHGYPEELVGSQLLNKAWHADAAWTGPCS